MYLSLNDKSYQIELFTNANDGNLIEIENMTIY